MEITFWSASFLIALQALIICQLSIIEAFSLNANVAWGCKKRIRKSFTNSKSWMANEIDNEGDNNNLDNLRRILETCWNTDTMGIVPTSADSAAESASISLIEAFNCKDISNNIFFVDILLPQYDVKQGSKIYDEILVIEFCIALSRRLNGKCNIIVRDEKTLNTVSRIFTAREGLNVTAGSRIQTETVSTKQSNLSDNDDVTTISENASVTNVEFYDDFAEFGLIGDRGSFEPIAINISMDNEESIIYSTEDNNEKESNLKISYRLSSMLGNSKISRGADMIDDVIAAVSANAQPTEDEETIMIVSAATPEEVIGIRGLVGKFKGKKNIILINCQIDNIPRELIGAQTVYSILPLIAQPKRSMEPPTIKEQDSCKVVVLRRYPRDWEVSITSYVDDQCFLCMYETQHFAQ